MTSTQSAAQRFSGLSDDEQQVLDQADRFARRSSTRWRRAWTTRNGGREQLFRALGATGYLRHHGAGDYGGVGADLFASRARAAGVLALEPRARSQLGRAREPLPQQHLPQRQRRAAQALSAGTVRRHAHRRAGPDRAGRRLGCDRLDAHDGAARRRPLRAERHASSSSPTVRSPTCCSSTPRPTRTRARKGISAFIVEKDFPGFQVAQKLTKMGFRGSQTGGAGVRGLPRAGREPASASEDRGVARRDERARPRTRDDLADLPRHRERALQLAHRTTPSTRSSSASRSASFQMIRAKLADMYVWVETMRTLHLPRAAARQRPGDRRRRPRRDSQAHRRVGDVCRRDA